MNWWPLHSWHPVLVHLPLVGLLLAVAFDLLAAQSRSARWRDAATVLWWLGLLGAAAAVTTGLIAYNRVEHSDAGHEEMILHRNVVYRDKRKNLLIMAASLAALVVFQRSGLPKSRNCARPLSQASRLTR